MDASFDVTRYSLLDRLRRRSLKTNDWNLAWEDFVQRYGRLLWKWCFDSKLSQDVTEDIVQAVLLKLHQHLGTYHREQKFRPWLKTVVKHAIADLVRSEKKHARLKDAIASIAKASAVEDLEDALCQEREREIFATAKRSTQLTSDGQEWEACRLTHDENKSAKDAAAA